MKKMFPLALVAMMVFPLVAQEESKVEEVQPVQKVATADSAMWPAFFAICQWPRSADVIGLRLTLPFSTSQENVTGLDVGFWGKSIYFEGLQVNLLRNNVTDTMSGIQVGMYNSVAFGDMMGLQIGLWNEAVTFNGFQVGLINVIGGGDGFQIGLINRAETMHGYQVGLFNIIRDAEVKFMPVINIGF